MRLDLLLVERGLVSSRQRAKEVILQGIVYVEGYQITKPSRVVSCEAKLEIRGEMLAYPSRAGLKLEKALRVFEIDVNGLVALDVGASTGGFTSCLLQNGAQRVYAVDVGQDQLVSELRNDPRVIVLEKTNIRDLSPSNMPELVNLSTIDVSFISLKKVLPVVRKFLKPKGQVIALVKPQFETDGIGLNKHGVITKKNILMKFIPPLINQLQEEGFGLRAFNISPISGMKGNLEYLAYFQEGAVANDATTLVREVIQGGWGN